MNAYTPTGQARIQSHDLATILRTSTGSYMAAASLAALERQRGWQAETEVDWLLKQNGLAPRATATLVSILRQAIGAALVRAGERLAGAPQRVTLPETAPVRGMLGTADY
jgi:hypothetical protein